MTKDRYEPTEEVARTSAERRTEQTSIILSKIDQFKTSVRNIVEKLDSEPVPGNEHEWIVALEKDLEIIKRQLDQRNGIVYSGALTCILKDLSHDVANAMCILTGLISMKQHGMLKGRGSDIDLIEALKEVRNKNFIGSIVDQSSLSDELKTISVQESIGRITTFFLAADQSFVPHLNISGLTEDRVSFSDMYANAIIKEAVRNVKKHGAPGSHRVEVSASCEGVTVSIYNDISETPSKKGTEQGVGIMNEFAGLMDARVSSHAVSQRRWLTMIRIPKRKEA